AFADAATAPAAQASAPQANTKNGNSRRRLPFMGRIQPQAAPDCKYFLLCYPMAAAVLSRPIDEVAPSAGYFPGRLAMASIPSIQLLPRAEVTLRQALRPCPS